MGHNWGVPAEFLVYERPPDWTMEHALAVTMLHDVCVRPGGIAAVERLAPIWDAWTEFGVQEPDCAWHPYWRNDHLVKASPEQMKVSLYSRGPKGALLVVSNLGAEACEATVRSDVEKLGLGDDDKLTARDALTGEGLALNDGELRVAVQPMKMRMVEVGQH